jgi:hypothetical protein
MPDLPGPDPRTARDPFLSHRRDAEDEDVEWLLGRGVPLAQALARVGLTETAWEKRNRRSA